MTSQYDGPLFCCDANVLIQFIRARRFAELEWLVERDLLRVPLGVYQEVYPQQREGHEKRVLTRWKSEGVIIDLDSDLAARALIPGIERRYGPPFHIGGFTYGGLWKGKSGRAAADAEVVAAAKAFGWVVISNDVPIHGACLLEGIDCYRWEYLLRSGEQARAGQVEPQEQPSLSPQPSLFDLETL